MHTGEPSAGGLAARLWASCSEEAHQSLQHPFVRALGQGKLPRDSFRSYIAQDVFYLDAFAQAYEMAISKAEGLPGDAENVLKELHNGVAEEVVLHTRYAEKLGVSPEEMRNPNPATLKYTAFLLDVAERQDVAHTLAAMAPCSRLYGFLGYQLLAEFPGHDHEYSAWIETYSGASYLELPDKKERLLNALSTDAEFGSLLELYKEAMQLELDFFEAHNPEHAVADEDSGTVPAAAEAV